MEAMHQHLIDQLTEELAHHLYSIMEPGIHQRIERDARAALHRLVGRWRFHVRCDEELNPPELRARGEVVLEVVLAPRTPRARQVVFRLTLK